MGDYVHAAIASIAIADKTRAGYKSQFLKRESGKEDTENSVVSPGFCVFFVFISPNSL
jgi:hypothetical protein